MTHPVLEGSRVLLPQKEPPVLIFARPTYGASPDRQIDTSHLAAIMYAANRGIKWAGPVCPDRVGWREARNGVVEETIEYACNSIVDGVIWVDDDVHVPAHAFYVLATHGLDLVGGLYFQRTAPYLPVAAKLTAKGDFDFWWDYPAAVLTPVDGVGFGCIYTSLHVLRAVAALPEAVDAGGPFSGQSSGKPYGEDFLFCHRAAKLGIQPHVDTGILCRHHLDSRYADEELFRRFRGELLPPSAPPVAQVEGFNAYRLSQP